LEPRLPGLSETSGLLFEGGEFETCGFHFLAGEIAAAFLKITPSVADDVDELKPLPIRDPKSAGFLQSGPRQKKSWIHLIPRAGPEVTDATGHEPGVLIQLGSRGEGATLTSFSEATQVELLTTGDLLESKTDQVLFTLRKGTVVRQSFGDNAQQDLFTCVGVVRNILGR